MKAHSFAVRAGGRTVRGWYGLLPDLPPPSVEAGVRLYHRLLAPIARRLTRESGTLASPQALRTADQVGRILARALRLFESGKLFERASPGPAEAMARTGS